MRRRSPRRQKPAPKTGFVVPAKAGTHSHHSLLLCKLSPTLLSREIARHGPRAFAGATAQSLCTSPSNSPPRPLPIGISQAALEDLAGILARQLFLDLDVPGDLVVG